MKRLNVDCTTLRALALTTPPTALESLDAGLTPNWRRQKRSSRFERAFLYFLIESSVGVATRFVGRLNRRVLSARVESALSATIFSCWLSSVSPYLPAIGTGLHAQKQWETGQDPRHKLNTIQKWISKTWGMNWGPLNQDGDSNDISWTERWQPVLTKSLCLIPSVAKQLFNALSKKKRLNSFQLLN